MDIWVQLQFPPHSSIHKWNKPFWSTILSKKKKKNQFSHYETAVKIKSASEMDHPQPELSILPYKYLEDLSTSLLMTFFTWTIVIASSWWITLPLSSFTLQCIFILYWFSVSWRWCCGIRHVLQSPLWASYLPSSCSIALHCVFSASVRLSSVLSLLTSLSFYHFSHLSHCLDYSYLPSLPRRLQLIF